MKKRNARSLSVVLLAVIILGLVIINASASCACNTTANWDWEYKNRCTYFELNADSHDVMEEDIACCRVCAQEVVYCTHWYSEAHRFSYDYLGYIESINMHEYERTCDDCCYSDIIYTP